MCIQDKNQSPWTLTGITEYVEDCLYLDIYTPPNFQAGEKKSVFIWSVGWPTARYVCVQHRCMGEYSCTVADFAPNIHHHECHFSVFLYSYWTRFPRGRCRSRQGLERPGRDPAVSHGRFWCVIYTKQSFRNMDFFPNPASKTLHHGRVKWR